MRIALLCATQRGLRVLEELIALVPTAELLVFSFRETPGEPLFLQTIRQTALEHGAQFHEARKLGPERQPDVWDLTPVDILFAVNWRYIVPAPLYARIRLGAFAFHDSLLPAYRGFSPSVWAIVNGEDHTGATLFHINDDVDAGDIVAQERVPIGPDHTIAEVFDNVTDAYIRLLRANLPALVAGRAPRTPQDSDRATFTCRRTLQDNEIDWGASTDRVYNLIRGVTSPYPGATTSLDGQPLIVWSARPLPDFKPFVGRVPGRVVEVSEGHGSVVLTGDGALLVTEVGAPGEPRRRADTVLSGLGQTLVRGTSGS